MMGKYFIVFLILFLFLSHNIMLASCSSGEIDKIAVVSWVWDGDTFDTEDNDRIRFADIDTPEEEPDIDAYWEAKNYTIEKTYGKTV